MGIVQRLDDYGKPAWIATMVLAFIVFWPVGLLVLAYLYRSGRMADWNLDGRHFGERRFGRWYGPCGGARRHHRYHARSSGNGAFDEYREETLRRLEDEQREFTEFLEQLRKAKDKAEFDQFMASRGKARRPDDDDRSEAGDSFGGDMGPQPA
ncbi:DUF2852 domain-containing protein [Zavarzinia compransoris]|uniref:DUF2852 domain-containing protein n=1 Tax=Zavarzinia marina TaxID=2911065 RepID=UPI001F46B08E|nr:DUF2852 domain-containing protein [Zavarzinia marina]MCF4164495.1 DUF2852 domain-containing protein [Zavarzinia marina]